MILLPIDYLILVLSLLGEKDLSSTSPKYIVEFGNIVFSFSVGLNTKVNTINIFSERNKNKLKLKKSIL